MNALFPLLESTKYSLLKAPTEEVGRFTRFKEYITALSAIQAAGRPNILLTTLREDPAQGGTYNEFDFWVEQQIKVSRTRRGLSLSEIAVSAPEEFRKKYQGRHSGRPLSGRLSDEEITLAFQGSYRKLKDGFGMFQDVNLKQDQEAQLHQAIIGRIIPVDEQKKSFSLSHTPKELAQLFYVTEKTIYDHLRRIQETYETKGHRLEYPLRIEQRTISIAHLISITIDELDRTGHYFKYHHYGVIELQAEIQKRLDTGVLDTSIYGDTISSSLLSSIINNYMTAGSKRDVYPHIQRAIPEIKYQSGANGAAQVIGEDILFYFQRKGVTFNALLKERILNTEKGDIKMHGFIKAVISDLGLCEDMENKHSLTKAREVLRRAIEHLAI